MNIIDVGDDDRSFEELYPEHMKRLRTMTDEEIDYTDIPRVTTLTGWEYADDTPVPVADSVKVG